MGASACFSTPVAGRATFGPARPHRLDLPETCRRHCCCHYCCRPALVSSIRYPRYFRLRNCASPCIADHGHALARDHVQAPGLDSCPDRLRATPHSQPTTCLPGLCSLISYSKFFSKILALIGPAGFITSSHSGRSAQSNKPQTRFSERKKSIPIPKDLLSHVSTLSRVATSGPHIPHTPRIKQS